MENQRNVAIMTWYAYRNYGSALQASALYEVIRRLGYAPCMINYAPKGDAVVLRDASLSQYALKALNRLKNRGKRAFVSPEREALFAEFLAQHITETEPRNTFPELAELNETFDAFVCGSDQIWAPVCFDDKYFLSFVEQKEKCVSYAPSIGLPRVANAAIREKMAREIANFTHLSVRETQGAELIRELTGKEATVVVDPTLLLQAEQWDNFAATEEAKKIDGEYIVCYFLGDAERYIPHVKRLSEKYGMPAYLIPVTKQTFEIPAVPFEVGPREFVSLIRGAAHVCTDSFHGMAFSVNYQTPFTVFKRFAETDSRNQNSRIISLLSLLSLEERLVDPAAECLSNTVDFSAAADKLETLRTASATYLINALQAACGEHEEPAEYRITSLCCGCGACAAICPTGAITIARDEEGFEQYRINTEKCVRCGRCKTVCPFNKIVAAPIKEAKELYAAKSTSKLVLKTSSSGGIGYELAKFGLENGAYVCGCTYDKGENKARHVVLSPREISRLGELQGSKYVQSVSADALSRIRHLPKGEKLLFFGTPCQTAGVDKLLTALGRRGDAILIDLICHGVPSEHLWNLFLEDVNRHSETGLHPTVQFRNKELSWRERQMTVTGMGNVYKQHEEKDDFYAFFRRGLCDMNTCFDCPYRERSAADIRLGDYWGPRFIDDTEGVSMVIAATEQGKELLSLLKESGACTLEPQALQEYWSVQFPYNHGKPVFREQLIAELKSGKTPLSALRKNYCRAYDVSEKLSKMLRPVKALLKKGAAK